MEIKNYIHYLILIILFIISLIFDDEILNFIIQNRFSFLNTLMIWITYIGSQIAVFLITTFLFLFYKKYKKIVLLWITLLSTFLITYFIKYTILRPRPIVEAIIQKSGPAFPSGHVTLIFSVLPLLDKEFPKLKPIWIIFAILVLLSRLYLGVHFPSDVIAGVIIGVSIGNIILYIQKHYLRLYVKQK